MPAKRVRVSLGTALLHRIDAPPETRAHGRSAFLRSAVSQYLDTEARQEIDARIAAAYVGQADAVLSQTTGLLEAQVWPDD